MKARDAFIWIVVYSFIGIIIVTSCDKERAAASETVKAVWVTESMAGSHDTILRNAVTYVDRYTKTRMIFAPCVPGERCIHLKPGRLNTGAETGWSKTVNRVCTITMDTRPVRKSYGTTYWTRLYQHELAHCFGLGHSPANNIMYAPILLKGKVVNQYFTPKQREILGRY